MVSSIANLIKSNRSKVVSFLTRNGYTIGRKDSDVRIGMKLEELFASPAKRVEFARVVGMSADGDTAAEGENITMELINSGIKKTASNNTIKVIIILLIVAIVFYFVTKKI